MVADNCLIASYTGQEVALVLQRLGDEGIRYCHWKSSAHLAESFASKTDFDLLVDHDDASRLRNCLQQYGVRRRFATSDKVYPGIEDYLGFDSATGALFHLHVHYRLVFGRKHEKAYRLPIESEILGAAVEHEVFPIRTICPELELILLVLRALLKSRLGPTAWSRPLRGIANFPGNIVDEFDYLACRINRRAFEDYATQLFPGLEGVFRLMTQSDINRLRYRQLRQSQQRVINWLKPYRLYSDSQRLKLRRTRQAAAAHSRTWLGHGGLCIAFVGADGSGKSATVTEIARWLGWKLSVQTAYMGIPKHDWRLVMLQRLRRAAAKARWRLLQNAIDQCRWVYIARCRYQTSQRATKLKSQNYLVIFDRYPLPAFQQMDQPMDGPRIATPRMVRDFERRFYDRIAKPDIVFLLQVSTEESLRRQRLEGRNKCDPNAVATKVAAVNRLAENDPFGPLVVVDTHVGTEQSRLAIKRKIWEIL